MGTMHPGLSETPYLIWSPPKAGTVNVRFVARDFDPACGDGVTIGVQKCNSSCTTLTTSAIANGDTIGVGWNGTVSLTTADSLWFSTYRNADNYCDYTSFDPTITY
jgi:hypothetical protein